MSLTEASSPSSPSSTVSRPAMEPVGLPDIEIAPPPPAVPAKAPRLTSLDAFRGLTIAAMILVNNLGDPKYTPLEHAEWNGWTFTDLIFPFFLFIVGVAMPFSFARRSVTTEQTRGQLLGRVWLRALSLWMLGQLLFAFPMPMIGDSPSGFLGIKAMRLLCFGVVWGGIVALLVPWKSKRLQTIIPIATAVGFYLLMFAMHLVRTKAMAAGWPAKPGFGGGIFNPDFLRIPGVLQRIGIVYGVAGTIALFAGWRTIILSAVALCALYAALMLGVPYGPEHTRGSLTFEDNLARHVDEKVFDRYTLNEAGKRVYSQRHAYSHYPDNEGLLSTIPAIATSLLGVLVGLWLRSGRTPAERAAGLLAMGVPVVVIGVLLSWWLMPINKILWTPSYVFFTAGLAMLSLGFLFWIIDALGYRKWSIPAVIFGMNAIAAYCAASIVPKMLNLIPIKQTDGETLGLYRHLQHLYVGGVERACAWITNLNPHMPVIATPMNMTLFTALFLVFLIWLLMTLMYLSRIFLKV